MSIKHINAAWAACTGSVNSKVVLALLADYADASGRCFPSIEKLSKRSELSRSSVYKALANLESKGFLTIIRPPFGVPSFTVNLVRNGDTSSVMETKSSVMETLHIEEPPVNHQSTIALSCCRSGVGEVPTISANQDELELQDELDFAMNESTPSKQSAQSQTPLVAPAPREYLLERPAVERNGTALTSQKPSKVRTAKPPPEAFLALCAGVGVKHQEVAGKAAQVYFVALASIRECAPDLSDTELAAEISRRCANFRLHFVGCTVTPMALAKHWPTMANPPEPREAKPSQISNRIHNDRELAASRAQLKAMGFSMLDMQNPEFVRKREALQSRISELSAAVQV